MSDAQATVDAAELAKGLAPATLTPPIEKQIELGTVKRDSVVESSIDDDNHDLPTEEELHTLRRVTGKVPWTAYTVALIEMFERFSYYGTTVVCKCSS